MHVVVDTVSGSTASVHTPLPMQLNDAPGAILVTYSIVAAASLIHLFKEDQPEAHGVGPFTAAAELFNGRAACDSIPCPL